MLKALLLIAAALWSSDALVSWPHADLYDQFDIEGVLTTKLNCSGGCYVFASVPVNPTGCEQNVFLGTTAANGEIILRSNISKLATRTDAAPMKFGMKFEPTDAPVIYNRNPGQAACSSAIYVVKPARWDADADPPSIYDPIYSSNVSGRGDHISFLSAVPFTLTHLDVPQGTSILAYNTGVEAFEVAPYACSAIYGTIWRKGQALRLPVRSPLLTVTLAMLNSGNRIPFNYRTASGVDDAITLTAGSNTVVTSYGHIGCETRDVFRFSKAPSPIRLSIRATQAFNISYIGVLDVPQNNPILVSSTGGRGVSLWGNYDNGNSMQNGILTSSGLKMSWAPPTSGPAASFFLRFVVPGIAPNETESVISTSFGVPSV